MGKNRKTFEGVRVPIECVATLSELAERLEALHGWRTWSVGGDEIRFVDKDGETGVVGTTGVAYRVHGRRRTVWEEQTVDWEEEFDAWSQQVWAEDMNGNAVMIHN